MCNSFDNVIISKFACEGQTGFIDSYATFCRCLAGMPMRHKRLTGQSKGSPLRDKDRDIVRRVIVVKGACEPTAHRFEYCLLFHAHATFCPIWN